MRDERSAAGQHARLPTCLSGPCPAWAVTPAYVEASAANPCDRGRRFCYSSMLSVVRHTLSLLLLLSLPLALLHKRDLDVQQGPAVTC